MTALSFINPNRSVELVIKTLQNDTNLNNFNALLSDFEILMLDLRSKFKSSSKEQTFAPDSIQH